VWSEPGLHVVDGSAVSANLGSNPSLTIAAQAERALAFWPVLGEPDVRPPLGAGYAAVRPTGRSDSTFEHSLQTSRASS
jgi:cholesterol oxidase